MKVLHTKDNSIEEMKMDEYLLGVVSAEMPADFEEEALKAQAVVARTYTVYKIEHNQSKHGEADICDNSACCQAWISKDDRMARWDEDKRESNWEKIEKAVSSTAGKVVTYNGEVIDAFFHSNSGGKTEEVSNVWGGSDLPYLQSVETSGEDAYSQYQSEAIFTKEEFEKKIKDKYPEFTIDYNDENCIKVIEYTQGDRVKTIKIGNLELSGVEVRSLLALRSANFTTQISENEIKLENDYVKKLKEYAKGENSKVIVVSAKIESELAELEDSDKEEMLNELGIEKSGLDKLIEESYNLLGLKTYFTCGPKEVKAWTYKDGMNAKECAGIIHSDFEKGFIKAEVISYNDLIEAGSELKVKENGKFRIEGKEYLMQDGDICHFRFNL